MPPGTNHEVASLLELIKLATGTVYHATPVPRADGEIGPLEVDENGNLKVAITADVNVDIDSSDLATHDDMVAANASLTSINTNVATAAKQDTGNTSLGSIDGKLGSTAAAAAADGETNATTMGVVRARLMELGGTTWERARSGLTTVSATVLGFRNTLPWALYHAVPVTRTEAQGGPFESDVKGNMRVTEQAPPAYENTSDAVAQTHEKPATSAAFNAIPYDTITKATAGVIKAAPGNLYKLYVTNDNAAAQYYALVNKATTPATGDTPVMYFMVPGKSTGVVEFKFGKRFSTGIGWAQVTAIAGTITTTTSDSVANGECS